MTGLSGFRDHCAAMADAEHKPECHGWITWERKWGPNQRDKVHPDPHCTGCNPAKDRALFALLAAEVDDYLAPQVDLFGELTDEPMGQEGDSSATEAPQSAQDVAEAPESHHDRDEALRPDIELSRTIDSLVRADLATMIEGWEAEK